MDQGSFPEASDRARWRYEVLAHSKAPPATVWPLIAETARRKPWSLMTRTFLLKDGAPTPDGVGALRCFAVGPFGSSAEVVAFEPPRLLGYVTLFAARGATPISKTPASAIVTGDPIL